MTKLESERDHIQKKLIPLREQQRKILSSINYYTSRLKKIENRVDQEYSLKIPKQRSKINKEQWEWILKAGQDETQIQYDYQKKFLKHFYRSCYSPETEQLVPSIFSHNIASGNGSKLNIKGMLSEFSYLKKYLKPYTSKSDPFKGKLGIYIHVHGLVEDYSSKLCVCNDDTVKLSLSRTVPLKTFNNFESFLEWYAVEIKKKEDDEEY